MKFEEVLPALREGKKIRRKKWDKSCYYRMIYQNDNNIIVNNYGEVVDVWDDIFINDWEIVEEVKEPKKIKLRDLTQEQFAKWKEEHCMGLKCRDCVFARVSCEDTYYWVKDKSVFSDKFLNQEVEIYE